jgi:hypothetical protein
MDVKVSLTHRYHQIGLGYGLSQAGFIVWEKKVFLKKMKWFFF